jgi:hypothetical protein
VSSPTPVVVPGEGGVLVVESADSLPLPSCREPEGVFVPSLTPFVVPEEGEVLVGGSAGSLLIFK